MEEEEELLVVSEGAYIGNIYGGSHRKPGSEQW